VARPIRSKGVSKRRWVRSQITTISSARGSGIRRGGEVKEAAESTAEKVKDTGERVAEKVKDKVKRAVDKVKNA
jgi:hypothetical protein